MRNPLRREPEPTKIERVVVLHLDDGDTLIIEVDRSLTREQRERIRSQLSVALSTPRNRVVICEAGMKVSKIVKKDTPAVYGDDLTPYPLVSADPRGADRKARELPEPPVYGDHLKPDV